LEYLFSDAMIRVYSYFW